MYPKDIKKIIRRYYKQFYTNHLKISMLWTNLSNTVVKYDPKGNKKSK